MRDTKKLVMSMAQLNIVLTEKQIQQFEDYYDLLIEWNNVMNLTAITEYEEVVLKHFVDSVSLVKAVGKDKIENASILDLGTGAGFPGVPLKILFPNAKVTLVDSLNKRIKFLSTVIEKLELQKVEAIHARAEEIGGKPEYREQYDFCVSRAVAKLNLLAEYCIPFVKKGGYFVSYKSIKATEEEQEADAAIKKLGGKVEESVPFQLPGSDIDRVLVKIKKVNHTAKEYPRPAAKIAKKPL